ncbi:putative periplasmic lipoprotein [Geothermobacter ehrlichii]|nr:hypothetical protein [Geothermobacter ehrlichii]
MKRWKPLFLAMALMTLSGCAALRQPPASRTIPPVRILNSGPVTIHKITLIEEDGGLVVVGKLRKLQDFRLPGHVDIQVCSPDGASELVRGKVRMQASKRRGVRESSFRGRLMVPPSSDALLQVRYHAAGDETGHAIRCP